MVIVARQNIHRVPSYLNWKGYVMKEIPQWIAMVMISVIGALAVMDRGHLINAIADLKVETKAYRQDAKDSNDKQDAKYDKVLDILSQQNENIRNQNHVIKTICGLIAIPFSEREKFIKTLPDWNGKKK